MTPLSSSLTCLSLASTLIGLSAGTTVKPEAARVELREGAIASVDGRFGTITRVPDASRYLNPDEAELSWLDDESDHDWAELDEIDVVVASRDDLVEDFRHLESLAAALSSCVSLVQLDVSDCGIGAPGMVRFVDCVEWEATSIRSLNVLGNPMHNAVDRVIEMFKQTDQIRTVCGFMDGSGKVDWRRSAKTRADALLLAAELSACRATSQVELLDISRNKIGEDAGVALVDAMCKPSSRIQAITFGTSRLPINMGCGTDQLELQNQKIDVGQAIVAFWWLGAHGTVLTSLNISGNDVFGCRTAQGIKISMRSVSEFAKAVGECKHLRLLDIEDTLIYGVSRPARSYGESNWTSENRETARGALKLLVEKLQRMSLTSLSLAQNGLDSDAITIVAAAVREMPGLQTLYLDTNKITRADVAARADDETDRDQSSDSNSSDEERDSAFEMDFGGLDTLCSAIGHSPIRQLSLRDCGLDDVACAKITRWFAATARNEHLVIDVGKNKLCDDALRAVREAAGKRATIKS